MCSCACLLCIEQHMPEEGFRNGDSSGSPSNSVLASDAAESLRAILIMAKGRGLAQVWLPFVVRSGAKGGWEYDAGITSVISLRAALRLFQALFYVLFERPSETKIGVTMENGVYFVLCSVRNM